MMKSSILLVACSALVLVHAQDDALLFESDNAVDSKAAPWWDALRAESYYRTCHSSCTENSRGTKTTVELCDDTKV